MNFEIITGNIRRAFYFIQPSESIDNDPRTLILHGMPPKDLSHVGGVLTLQIHVAGGWYTNSVPSWLQLSSTRGLSGEEIDISYSRNTSTQRREAELTFHYHDRDSVFQLSQAGAGAYIDITELPNLEEALEAGACTLTFYVTSAQDWTGTDDVNWLDLSPVLDKLV